MRRRAIGSKGPTDGAGEGGQPDLSPRQQQILERLREGKVNKEIARELGIGLGTVKQHVVALFKKLDVTNRAMAVSRGMQNPAAPHDDIVPTLPIEGLLEYRPCVVLSVALDESASAEAGKKMQQVLAAYAYDHDAIFLARKAHAGDLILGIQRASEQDLYLALSAARIVFGELAGDSGHASGLRGGLTAGLAVASMHRVGGWSGEAIASIAITQGRELAGRAAAGRLLLAKAVRDLLSVQSPNAAGVVSESLEFDGLRTLPWPAGATEELLLGRETELRLIESMLEKAATSAGGLLQLGGETGMGKSRLCRYAAARAVENGGTVHHYACRPDGDPRMPFATTCGEPVTSSVLLENLSARAVHAPAVFIVDDCHYLPPSGLAELTQRAAAATDRLVILAARRFAETGVRPAHAIRLSRLGPEMIALLATSMPGASRTSSRIASIVRRAAGVPLFALELARQRRSDALPLSLRALIGARLDAMKLDRALLRGIARARAAMNVATLARELNESPASVEAAVARALAAGVLTRDDLGKVRFAHPLLRQAIDLACVE